MAQKSERLVAFGAAQGLNPEQLGLKSGIFIAILFPIFMLIGIAALRKDKTRAV
jgi:hypothetical protein